MFLKKNKEKIALIAGDGNLPFQIIKELEKNKQDFVVIALQGFANADDFAKYETYVYYMGSMKRIITKLHSLKVKRIVFAGSVKKPSLSDIKLDSISYKILCKAIVQGFGDDRLLRLVMKELEKHNFKVVSSSEICPELLVSKGKMGKVKIHHYDKKNIQKGIKVLKATADLDIGQSVIIDQGSVLGLEAIEGTEDLIKRCKKLRISSKKAGVLVKMKKIKQSEKVDMPTVGINTLKQLEQSGFAGIAIEAGGVQVVNKEKFIETADELGLFIEIF